MSNSKRKNYEGALLEEINSKLDGLLVVLTDVVDIQKIHTQKLKKLDELASDIMTIISAVAEQSTEIKDQVSRINRLETKVFG